MENNEKTYSHSKAITYTKSVFFCNFSVYEVKALYVFDIYLNSYD